MSVLGRSLVRAPEPVDGFEQFVADPGYAEARAVHEHHLLSVPDQNYEAVSLEPAFDEFAAIAASRQVAHDAHE